jgi:hypothetical protein
MTRTIKYSRARTLSLSVSLVERAAVVLSSVLVLLVLIRFIAGS